MTIYCAFCDNKATHKIDRSNTPICQACLEVYEAGQSNPEGTITSLEEP
jgi:hypothetical protein